MRASSMVLSLALTDEGGVQLLRTRMPTRTASGNAYGDGRRELIPQNRFPGTPKRSPKRRQAESLRRGAEGGTRRYAELRAFLASSGWSVVRLALAGAGRACG